MDDNSILRILLPLENNFTNQQFINDNNNEASYKSLINSVMQNDTGSIIWLINEGCPLNNSDIYSYPESPLHIAVNINNIYIAELLISAGAQIHAINYKKITPLHKAFEMNNDKMVDLLLSKCDVKVNPFSENGLSHFHIACIRNNPSIVLSFLEHGIDSNVSTEKIHYNSNYAFDKPLHLAVKFECLETVDLLLKYGANVHVKDRHRRTPLHLACRFNRTRISKLVGNLSLKTSDEVINLIKIKNDQVDIVKLLLQYRSDVHALDFTSQTPLHYLFKCDHLEAMGIIGKKILIENIDHWKTFVNLRQSVQKKKFYSLIMGGANINFRNKSNNTLLHLIIGCEDVSTYYYTYLELQKRELDDESKAEFIDLILNYGVDVNAININGQTALFLSISSYYVKITKTLLDHNANLNKIPLPMKIPERNISGNFILIKMENFLDIISLIFMKKSDLNMSRKTELLILMKIKMEWNGQYLENCSISMLSDLLDFGDINCIDTSVYTSERWVLSNRLKTNFIIQHIKKLEIAGLYVNENIKREFFKYSSILDGKSTRLCSVFNKNCSEEIKTLKGIMIDRYASFYDLLFLSVNDIAVRVKNKDFRQSIRINCYENLSMYNNIIKKKFVEGLVRSILLELIKEYLNFISKLELPDPCSENILIYLKNTDLCNLALAFEI
jgi:ankyrin repeat protein